jgi:hypothetical protein
LFILVVVIALIGTIKPSKSSDSRKSLDETPEPRRLNPRLLELKPNVWMKVNEARRGDWYRQVHAGIAYDSKRGTILVFGSDTHGHDWDNEIHEFDPMAETWTTHYARAPRDTYRADSSGRAIAGDTRLLPWAMHAFDNLVYDPRLDAMVLTAIPLHNPIGKEIPDAKIHPTWIYDLAKHKWRIFENRGRPYPNFFAAASAYDSDRDVIVAYSKWGVWEMGADRKEWRKATSESHHEIHHNMVYDSIRKVFAVFGDYRATNAVWIYGPGPSAGAKGMWEKRIPRGDQCPKDQHFPVAFDEVGGVFLLVVDDMPFVKEKDGQYRPVAPKSSSTFVYDLETNRYTKIPGADMQPLGMNYMMVYDQYHRVFFLVTGDDSKLVTVWALNLEPNDLKMAPGGHGFSDL